MCYWVGTKNVREKLLKQRNEKPENEIPQLFYRTFVENHGQMEFKEHFVAIGKANPYLSVIINNGTGKQFRNIKWGLQWSYTNKKTGKEYSRELLNSTAEKVFFQHRDLIYNRRCLIPIDGYFEYFHFGGEVYPHFIYPSDDEIFYAGGIWDSSVDNATGEVSETLSIITTTPNELASKLHNNPRAPNGPRMLLLIPEELTATFLNTRLDTSQVKTFFKAFPAEKMKAYPVMRFQRKENLAYMNTDEVRKPFQYPELNI